MEGGVGLWTETAVIEQLKNWKLSLMPSITPVAPTPIDETIDDGGGHVAEPPATTFKHSKAKEKIQSISSVDEAKRILDALCDLGLDSILNIILK